MESDDLFKPLPPELLDGRSWKGFSLAGTAWIIPAFGGGYHLGCLPIRDGGRRHTVHAVKATHVRLWLTVAGFDPDTMQWKPSDVVAVDDRNPVSDERLLYGPKRKADGVVYFIQMEGHPAAVKIGYTSHGVVARVQSLQVGCPYRLRVLAAVPGTMADELALHSRFAALRIRPDGEWFYLLGDLKVYINSLAKGGDHRG